MYRIYIIIGFFFLIACGSQKNLFTSEELNHVKADIENLAADDMEGRRIGTQGEQMAAAYISERFKEIGLTPLKGETDYYQRFSVTQSKNPHAPVPDEGDEIFEGINLAGMIDNGAAHTVVLGAHYDHLGHGGFGSLHIGALAIHNGADDNASGVATMLSLAKKLKAGPTSNNYLFLAFSGEEMGLWGSNHWVKNSGFDLSSINYMLNMDMVGRLNDEKSLMINGTGTSPIWDNTIAKCNKFDLNIIPSASGIGPSDHTSFYVEDIPVLAFFTGQHEDYHKPTDDAHKINYSGIQKISNLIMNIILELDNQGKIGFSKTKDEEQEPMDFKVTLGVMPDYLYQGEGMRIDGVREGRPAGNAEIVKGDVVVKMGNLDIHDMKSYMQALGAFEPGSTIPVVILRDGEEIKKMITFDPPK